jgi:hypothetical protein
MATSKSDTPVPAAPEPAPEEVPEEVVELEPTPEDSDQYPRNMTLDEINRSHLNKPPHETPRHETPRRGRS